MKIPKSIESLVALAIEQFPDDTKSAVEKALDDVKKLPEFDTYVEALIRYSLTQLAYAARHQINVKIKKEQGHYATVRKVAATSVVVNRVYRSLYDYRIGGKTLGQVTGRDIDTIINRESASAEGHLFNVRLCYKLQGLVGVNETVREVLSEKKLQDIFQEVQEA